MGGWHAAVWKRLAGVELAGVAGRTPERARGLAKSLGVPVVNDPRRLIDAADIDAIDVCTPTAAHAGWVAAALEAGKHVICETPLCATAAGTPASSLDLVGNVIRALYRAVKGGIPDWST